MFPVINLLGRPLPVGAISILFAFYLGSELAERALGNAALDAQRVTWRKAFGQATLIALVVGLVGARLGYAARYYQLYAESPGLLLSLRPGTLAIMPGLFLGGAFALFYLSRKQIPLAKIADAVAIGVTGALVTLSVGDFFTGNAYGTPTDVPWGVELWNTMRHPVQLYDAIVLLIVLVVLWYLHKKIMDGELFWRFLMLYSLSRLFLGMFYATSAIWGPGVRINQIISLVTLLVSLFVLSFFAQQRERTDEESLKNQKYTVITEM